MERLRNMTVGAAGRFNDTNVRSQYDGGVSLKRVEQFRKEVRSTTPNDASGAQSSKGKPPAEHSQDTSKSFAIILATRPPINLGNPIGKQGALYDGDGKQSRLRDEGARRLRAPAPTAPSECSIGRGG